MAPLRTALALTWLLAAIVASLSASPRALAAASSAIDASVATRSYFDPTLRHTIEDLTVTVGGQQYAAGFLSYYEQTGGLDRWGYPTSEVFQEEPGNLTQYYQRGVVDWHWRADLQAYVLERRLAWDYLGGDGAGPGQDQGVEPPVTADGNAIGPWGHTVSDTSVDGTATGFDRFFSAHGGVASFGYPKTEARVDTGSGLHLPTATPGFIRQYFQAAVLEYHPDLPQDSVELRLLGDDVRDRRYPNGAWRQVVAFQPAEAAATSPAVGTAQGALQLDPPRVQEGRSVEVHLSAAPGQTLHGQLDGRPAFELAAAPAGGYWGIVGVDPWATVGTHTVSITADAPSGATPVAQGTIQVLRTDFPWTADIAYPPGRGDITQPDVQAAENRQLGPIFTAFTPQPLWDGPFIWPATGPVTNAFGTGYSSTGGKTFHNYHEGIDIGAAYGSPIVAANTGRVVLAGALHVRGNGVIIDHGMGIFSGYYHMSRIVAREGTLVHKGDLIGYVGDTGLATGPHLHWEIRADNQYVDPTEWLNHAFEP